MFRKGSKEFHKYVLRCAIWYHLYSLKKVKNTFKSNHPKYCSKNITFSIPRRIYMITEKDYLEEMKMKELKTLILEQH